MSSDFCAVVFSEIHSVLQRQSIHVLVQLTKLPRYLSLGQLSIYDSSKYRARNGSQTKNATILEATIKTCGQNHANNYQLVAQTWYWSMQI